MTNLDNTYLTNLNSPKLEEPSNPYWFPYRLNDTKYIIKKEEKREKQNNRL